MSDSYYQFSVEIPGLRAPEKEWLIGVLLANKLETPPKGGAWEYLKTEFGLQDSDRQDWDPFPDFEWEMRKSLGRPGIVTFSAFSEESGNLSQVAHITHRLMKKFNMQGYLKFSASATCSRPITDQFGGDIVWITKNGCLWSTAIENMLDSTFETGEAQSLETDDVIICITNKNPYRGPQTLEQFNAEVEGASSLIGKPKK